MEEGVLDSELALYIRSVPCCLKNGAAPPRLQSRHQAYRQLPVLQHMMIPVKYRAFRPMLPLGSPECDQRVSFSGRPRLFAGLRTRARGLAWAARVTRKDKR